MKPQCAQSLQGPGTLCQCTKKALDITGSPPMLGTKWGQNPNNMRKSPRNNVGRISQWHVLNYYMKHCVGNTKAKNATRMPPFPCNKSTLLERPGRVFAQSLLDPRHMPGHMPCNRPVSLLPVPYVLSQLLSLLPPIIMVVQYNQTKTTTTTTTTTTS